MHEIELWNSVSRATIALTIIQYLHSYNRTLHTLHTIIRYVHCIQSHITYNHTLHTLHTITRYIHYIRMQVIQYVAITRSLSY